MSIYYSGGRVSGGCISRSTDLKNIYSIHSENDLRQERVPQHPVLSPIYDSSQNPLILKLSLEMINPKRLTLALVVLQAAISVTALPYPIPTTPPHSTTHHHVGGSSKHEPQQNVETAKTTSVKTQPAEDLAQKNVADMTLEELKRHEAAKLGKEKKMQEEIQKSTVSGTSANVKVGGFELNPATSKENPRPINDIPPQQRLVFQKLGAQGSGDWKASSSYPPEAVPSRKTIPSTSRKGSVAEGSGLTQVFQRPLEMKPDFLLTEAGPAPPDSNHWR